MKENKINTELFSVDQLNALMFSIQTSKQATETFFKTIEDCYKTTVKIFDDQIAVIRDILKNK